jgi:hypothetical protein
MVAGLVRSAGLRGDIPRAGLGTPSPLLIRMRPLARRDLALLRQLDHVDRWGMANIKVYCRPSQQHACGKEVATQIKNPPIISTGLILRPCISIFRGPDCFPTQPADETIDETIFRPRAQ